VTVRSFATAGLVTESGRDCQTIVKFVKFCIQNSVGAKSNYHPIRLVILSVCNRLFLP
jgi:hypothetical protein